MALRSRDVTLASVAAFIAWGFATHWVPSIRFLPYAFVGGIVVAVSFSLWAILYTSKGPERASVNHYGSKNVFFVAGDNWQAEKGALEERAAYQRKPIYPPSFLISDKLDGLIELIIRDFVTIWFGKISKRPVFGNDVDRAIRTAAAQILERLTEIDLVEFGTLKLVPILNSHLRDFYDADRAVRGRKFSRNITESEELDLAIAGKFRDGKLHPAATLTYSDPKHSQQQHLRNIVVRILPEILPPSMITSPSVNALIKELVSCAVLSPIVQSLSDPDIWNQLIENFGGSLLQERKSVRKLRAALDEHAPPSPSKGNKSVQFPKLSPNDNERKFERFVRAIKQCNSLSDARRFRNEVASQLRRDSAMESQDPIYIKRLETGKRLLDQRVAMLGAGGSMKKPPSSLPNPQLHVRAKSRIESLTLRDMLHDASGMSYFMEFMDRQGLMRLVQFWIVVDGIRNPLEGDQDDPDDQLGAFNPWTESERTDLAQINEGYITKPELKIPNETRQTINNFLRAGKTATPLQYHLARKAVLQAQTAIYHEMVDKYFLRFKKSDLYFKYLASDENAAAVSNSQSALLSPGDNISPTSMMAPPKIPRASSARAVSQAPDFRRAVASSSDLKHMSKFGNETPVRRSLDSPAPRAPLFDDDYDSEPLSRSNQSFGSSDLEASRGQLSDSKVVDAMQAALNDIIEDKPDRESLFPDSTLKFLDDDVGDSIFEESRRSSSPFVTSSRKDRPSIASLGLVGAPSTLGVFNDDLFGDEEKFLEDEKEDSDQAKTDEEEIHEAAPGDLGLAEAIDVLTQDIEKLVTQESIVDSLTKKAELTNNAAELRILRKSKASLQREIRKKELQRQQYIVQESDNSLYGRATISIKSIMVGYEDDGREFAMYVIEVQREAGDQMPAAVWVVTRRYSEFHDLNKRLRAKYPHIRGIEFPRRQMVLKLQRDFLQKRRAALERYLKELLLIPAVCRSRELRSFLSEQAISSVDPNSAQNNSRDFVTRIYSSVTDGMEEFLGNIPVLDQLTVAGQNLISAATSQLASSPGAHSFPEHAISSDPTITAEAEAELRAYENREMEPFVKPICDIFLELFELNRESNWLRGRAVVVVLHQLLGGTVERKVRENAKVLMQEESIVRYLDLVKGLMWPDGKLRQAAVRTSAEKKRSRREAELILQALMPELVGTVVGRANAQAASRRIIATLNNPRLNTHLIFTILDEIISTVFGDPLHR